MSFVESHLLTLVIFLPVLGAVLIALLPRSEGGQQKGIAFLFSLLTFLISIPLWTGFLGPLVVLSSWKYIQERVSLYCIALLLLETALLGTLGALHLVTLYVFWAA